MSLLPGAMLGMLGGGQLGRLFVQAAESMGYRVTVLDPDPDSPAGELASCHLQQPYTDRAALEQIAQTCCAVSLEFENIPLETLQFLQRHTTVRPTANAVAITQHRLDEKNFITQQGLGTAAFAAVHESADIGAAFRATGASTCLLKTARYGYDGRGQMRCNNLADIEQAFTKFGQVACILEAWVPYLMEISVVLARNAQGQIVNFPVAHNVHVDGILERSVVPAPIDPQLEREAYRQARLLAEALDYVGVFCVEMFVAPDHTLLINEMAPRVHNSAHYTMDATNCSQFEQQVRVLCDLPLVEVTLSTPVVMLNLLGELWQNGEPDWGCLPAAAHLHLYGKKTPRLGRKMGHVNLIAPDVDQAQALAATVRAQL